MQSPSLGGSGGAGLWQGLCPQGAVMTGIQAASDGRLAGFYNVKCKYPREVDTPGTGAAVPVAGQNFTVSAPPVSYDCPAGYAMNSFSPRTGDWMDGIQFGCARFADNAGPQKGPILGGDNNVSSWTAPPRNFLTGMSGRSGSRIDSAQASYADFSTAIARTYTESGIADGCMGVGDPTTWKYQPGSGDCDSYMVTQFCQKYPTDPRCSCVTSEMTCPNKFDQNCIKNNGYRTSDMLKAACPNVMNCVQYNRLSPGAKMLATNIDQSCSSSSNTNTSTAGNTSGSAGTSWGWGIWLLLIVIVLVVLGLIGAAVYAATKGPVSGAYDVVDMQPTDYEE